MKKKLLIIATHNCHKLAEIRKILKGAGISVKPLSTLPPMPEVVENHRTLEANAAKKALAVTKPHNLPALADDSGLFVPALKYRPGVKSARYAGPGCNYADNNVKLLNKMRNLKGKERKAYFAASIALALPGKPVIIRTAKVWGYIGLELRGKMGFGYDPLFRPLGFTQTFAEMSPQDKNCLSHRGRALKKMAPVIKRVLKAW